MFRPSLGELLIIALVVLLVFGSRRLPELGKAIGSAIRNFQKSIKGEDNQPSDEKQVPDNDKPINETPSNLK